MSPRQLELLTYIQGYTTASGGMSPSYVEMMKFMGVKSKSVVARHVGALVRDGYLKHKMYSQRDLEVVRMPGNPLLQLQAAVDRMKAEQGHPITARILYELSLTMRQA